MKISPFLIVAVLLLSFVACETDSPNESPGQHLPLTIFEIQANQDTLLIGPGGVRLHIPATTWQTEAGNAVEGTIRIHLQEALTLTDMVMGELSTATDSGLLESDGMFYWEAVDGVGERVKPKSFIQAEVPINRHLPDAQLYSGKVDRQGKIVWGNAVELAEMSEKKKLAHGQTLFKTHCRACHKIGRDMTGPALAGTTSLFEWDWLLRFTRNAPAMINEGDSLAILIYERWGTMMQATPSLSDQDIDAIYRYIDFKSLKFDLDSLVLAKKKSWSEMDSIGKILRQRWIEVNKGKNFFYRTYPINDYGWYNIDRLYKQELSVIQYDAQISLSDPDEILLRLILPENRIIVPGFPKNNRSYYFNYGLPNEQSYLPLNKSAQLVAIVHKDGQDYLGVKESIIQDGVTEEIEVLPLSVEEMKGQLKRIFQD